MANETPAPAPVPATAVWVDPVSRTFHIPAGWRLQSVPALLGDLVVIHPQTNRMNIPETYTQV